MAPTAMAPTATRSRTSSAPAACARRARGRARLGARARARCVGNVLGDMYTRRGAGARRGHGRGSARVRCSTKRFPFQHPADPTASNPACRAPATTARPAPVTRRGAACTLRAARLLRSAASRGQAGLRAVRERGRAGGAARERGRAGGAARQRGRAGGGARERGRAGGGARQGPHILERVQDGGARDEAEARTRRCRAAPRGPGVGQRGGEREGREGGGRERGLRRTARRGGCRGCRTRPDPRVVSGRRGGGSAGRGGEGRGVST